MSILTLSTPQAVTVASYQVVALNIDLVLGVAQLRYIMLDTGGNPIGAPQVATLPNTQLKTQMPALLAALSLDMQEALGVAGVMTGAAPPPAPYTGPVAPKLKTP